MNNKHGNKNIWFGVVEERTTDPLFLGRCRVRIAGLHTSNKNELPTKDLPWAFPIVPITSASMNGIGQAPVGPVEGTWVAVQFLDTEFQQPVMVGTIGGIPIESNAKSEEIEDFLFNTVSKPNDPPPNAARSSDGTAIRTESGGYLVSPDYGDKRLGGLNDSQYEKLKDAIGKRESSNNYKAVNQLGYLGKYQFGALNLIDQGYLAPGTTQAQLKAGTATWTGKDGINSNDDFLSNKKVQESCMDTSLKTNFKRTGLTGSEPIEKQAGVLTAAHLVGAGGAKKMLKGETPKDANGVSAQQYYKLGYESISGQSTRELPSEQNIQNTAVDKNASQPESTNEMSKNDVSTMPEVANKNKDSTDVGFTDPDKKYPKKQWLKEPDTHRLARHQSVDKTIVYSKEQERQKGITIANSGKTWEQQLISYNTKYPFNHILESESGHTIEIDDTSGSERIHIYHKTGTFIEIDPTGSITTRSKGHSVSIVEKDDKTHITGSGVLLIDGDFALKVQKTYQIEVLGDAQIKVNGSCRTQVSGGYDLNVGGACKITAGGGIHLQGGGLIAGDAGAVHWNSGMAASAASVSPFSPDLTELHPVTRQSSNDFVMEDASPEAKEKYVAEKEASNNTPYVEPVKTPKLSTKPPPVIEPYIASCKGTSVQKPYTRDTQLSTNFTLGMLCVSPGGGKTDLPPEDGQVGLTQDAIVCNLMQLCLNILEPLMEKWPDIKINSGFRIGSGTSQHNQGCAVDITRSDIEKSGSKKQLMQDWAIEVKDSVGFDQLILETSGGPTSAWVHVSFNPKGNRSASDPNKMITINTASNKKTYGIGFA